MSITFLFPPPLLSHPVQLYRTSIGTFDIRIDSIEYAYWFLLEAAAAVMVVVVILGGRDDWLE